MSELRLTSETLYLFYGVPVTLAPWTLDLLHSQETAAKLCILL